MKIRAKITSYMGNGKNKDKAWIIKGQIYELHKRGYGNYEFKSEIDDRHYLNERNLDEYFEKIPNHEPRICEILGVELNKRYNIKGYKQNPIKVKYSNDNEEILVVNSWGVISSKTLIDLIEHPELIEKIPEWTDEQKKIFKALKVLGFKYITRDSDYSIYAFEFEPEKGRYDWQYNDSDRYIELKTDKILNTPHLNFIDWKDEYPFEIPDIQ